MTTTYYKQVLLKRGNTSASSSYTGPIGEITLDTDTKQLRVHDGVTVGGTVVVGEANLYPITTRVDQLELGQTAANTIMASIPVVDLVSIASNILPSTSLAYSLGSADKQWRDLWVGNSTVYIGGTPLTIIGNTLMVNGQQLGSASYDLVNVDQVTLSPGTFQGSFTDAPVVTINLTAETGQIEIVREDLTDPPPSYAGIIFTLDGTDPTWTTESTENFPTNGLPLSLDANRGSVRLTVSPGSTLKLKNGDGDESKSIRIREYRASTLANPVTGNINVMSGTINFVPNSSADGNGYSTMEIVPDNSLYSNHQYLVVDPTTPNHIHIRAGGPHTLSNTLLFLGGEKTYVRVDDDNGVRVNYDSTLIQSYYYLGGADYTNGTWFTDNGLNYFQFTYSNSQMVSNFWDFVDFAGSKIEVYDGVTYYQLTYNGWAGSMGGNTYRVQVAETPPNDPFTTQDVSFILSLPRTNYLVLENSELSVSTENGAFVTTTNNSIRFTNKSTTNNVEIITNDSAQSMVWQFKPNGGLVMPGAVINSTLVASAGVDSQSPSLIDLTKTVQKLTSGYYTLPNGDEGQVIYLTSLPNVNPQDIYVIVSSGKGTNGVVYQNILFQPFFVTPVPGVVTMVFTDGFWQSSDGLWD